MPNPFNNPDKKRFTLIPFATKDDLNAMEARLTQRFMDAMEHREELEHLRLQLKVSSDALSAAIAVATAAAGEFQPKILNLASPKAGGAETGCCGQGHARADTNKPT